MAERDDAKKKGRKIAITGKGGSGKTMLAAIMTKLLAETGKFKILVIDADSAINLPYTLGIRPGKTVAEIRGHIIEDPEAKREIEDKSIRTVIAEALTEGKGFQLLVMGRPEGPGCYCGVNDLLRYGIESLSKQFDITIIDCEAGPEQVSRRVVEGVDTLLVITEPTVRGTQVAGAIIDVAKRDEHSPQIGLVINRFRGDDSMTADSAGQWGVEIFGRIPEDENIARYDSVGKPIIDLPPASPSVLAVQRILEKIGVVESSPIGIENVHR